jgi:hypothetical protein
VFFNEFYGALIFLSHGNFNGFMMGVLMRAAGRKISDDFQDIFKGKISKDFEEFI